MSDDEPTWKHYGGDGEIATLVMLDDGRIVTASPELLIALGPEESE